MKHAHGCLPLLGLLWLAACTSGGGNPPAPADGRTSSVDMTLPDELVRAPAPPGVNCGVGSYRLVQQRFRATAVSALGQTGGPDAPQLPFGVWETHTSVSDARYTSRQQPVGPNCADLGPLSPVLVVRLAYGHEAWVDRSPNPVCVWRSNIAITSYAVDDVPPGIGELIRARVHDGAHRGTDRAVASGLNELFWGAALSAAAEARCNDWASL